MVEQGQLVFTHLYLIKYLFSVEATITSEIRAANILLNFKVIKYGTSNFMMEDRS